VITTPFATANLIPSLACSLDLTRHAAYAEPRWYAAYTRANHERRTHEQFLERSVDSFLPAYLSVRRWKDRRVRLQMPLFPGYVFVRISLRERLRVLEVSGVVRLVGFNGVPAALEEEEVECLRRALAQGASARPHPYLTVGRRVRVIGGPLQGAEGTLVKRKGNFRVILSVNLIRQSVIVDVSEADLEPMSAREEPVRVLSQQSGAPGISPPRENGRQRAATASSPDLAEASSAC